MDKEYYIQYYFINLCDPDSYGEIVCYGPFYLEKAMDYIKGLNCNPAVSYIKLVEKTQ